MTDPDRITFPINTFSVSPTVDPLSASPAITPILKFEFVPSTSVENHVQIALKYDRSNGDTVFHSNLIFDGVLENGNYIKLTIFGHVVYEKIIDGVTSINL